MWSWIRWLSHIGLLFERKGINLILRRPLRAPEGVEQKRLAFCSFLKDFNLFPLLSIQRGSGMPSEALFKITLLILPFATFFFLLSREWRQQHNKHGTQMIYTDDSVLIYMGMGMKEENCIETIYVQFANYWDSSAQLTLSQCRMWLRVLFTWSLNHFGYQVEEPRCITSGY